MKMYRSKLILLLVLLALAFGPLSVRGEDVLQVVPFRTEAGMTTDDGCQFVLQLNSTQPYWGIQFELQLPEGMTLDDTDGADPFELSEDRFPFTKRGSRVTFKHSVVFSYGKNTPGWYTVIISPNDRTSFISAGEGEALRVYFKTEAGMPSGVYPIRVKDVLMVLTSQEGVRPGASTSYVTVGNASAVADGVADFSFLTDYVPSFVMESLGGGLASETDLAALDLTGAASLGAIPRLSHPNALCLVGAGTQAEAELAEADVPNVAVPAEDGTLRCRRLELHEEHSFAPWRTIVADEAVLRRGPLSASWNTLCLPFALSPEQVEQAFGAGSYVQQFEGRDGAALCFRTAAQGLQAHVPCLLYVPEIPAAEAFSFGSVTLEASSAAPETVAGGVRFAGNYGGHRSATGLYGVTPDSRVARGGAAAMLQGFRACFDLSGVSAAEAATFYIRHDGLTGVSASPAVRPAGETNVYAPDGRLVRENVSAESATRGLGRGIYIVSGKKLIIR